MTIEQFSKSGAIFESAKCYRNRDEETSKPSKLVLTFRGGIELILAADYDTDEIKIAVSERPSEETNYLDGGREVLAEARGLLLTWFWEMKNQQGYLDAVQLELASESLECSMIYQFKVAASAIEIFKLRQIDVLRP